MKVIDILVKIANGEEVPPFRLGNREFKYNKEWNDLEDLNDTSRIKDYFELEDLNKKVEIIGE